MRYTITRQLVQVIGPIWWPSGAICAAEFTVDTDWMIANGYDPKNQDDVERWVLLHHCGDFQSVQDMRADFHLGDEHVVHGWRAGEESELAFYDAMYPSED